VVPVWYVGVLGLAGVQRLRELAISRSHESGVAGRRAAARSYPAMVAAHVGLFVAPLVEVGLLRRRSRVPWLWGGLVCGAAALRWWSITSLGRSWNVRAVVPPDLRPVASGPYRFVRHPNYVAVALEFLALPMLGGAWISAVTLSALNGLVLYDRVVAEEKLLDLVPGYRDAFRGRARFIPGIF
jgi:methyltransferase